MGRGCGVRECEREGDMREKGDSWEVGAVGRRENGESGKAVNWGKGGVGRK